MPSRAMFYALWASSLVACGSQQPDTPSFTVTYGPAPDCGYGSAYVDGSCVDAGPSDGGDTDAAAADAGSD